MAFAVLPKNTLLVPSGPKDGGKHLYIVMTSPCLNGQCLLTTLCSIKNDQFYDDACVVQSGDHPFATHPSYIEYRLSAIKNCDQIIKAVDGWYYDAKEPVSDALFERIGAGLISSDFTPRYVVSYYREQTKAL